MRLVQRYSLAAAGLVCLAAFLPPVATAQPRGRQPNADTPRILVATFRSSGDTRIGVEGAEALRMRVTREVDPRDLWVVPREQMNIFLETSGYPKDTTLSLADLKELAQRFRADAIIDGVVTKTPTGVALSARLVLPSNLGLVQPLPVVEAPTLADAAKQLERHLEDAQRSLLDFRRCANALSAQKYDEAHTAAQLGIVRYPTSTLSRLCLMDAYSREQQPIDSVIHAAEAVLRIDSTSVLALMNLASSYREKQDTNNAIDAMRRLVVYRPDLRPELVRMLAQMNRPRIALPIVTEMLRENPGDAEQLKQRWLLLLMNRQWKEALHAGEELTSNDTAAANQDYFTRAMAAALSDSQPALAAELGARAVGKFPAAADLWTLTAQAQRKADRRADAVVSLRRALALNPKTENGWPLLVATQIELGQVDSAIASARLGLTAGADSSALRGILRVPLATAAKRANEAKSRAAWMDAYRLTTRVDSVAPSADSKYFLSLAAFQIGYDALTQINEKHSCDEVTLIEEMWAIALINAPLGAQAGPEQRQGAAQMMTVIQQYSDPVAKAKAAFCKRRR